MSTASVRIAYSGTGGNKSDRRHFTDDDDDNIIMSMQCNKKAHSAMLNAVLGRQLQI